MSLTIQQGVDRVLEVCTALKPGERLALLVDDDARMPVAAALSATAEVRGATCALVTVKDADLAPDLPADRVPQELLGFDVLIGLTARSLYHATIGRTAADHGSRVLALTQVDLDLLRSDALAADFLSLEAYAQGLASRFDGASTIAVASPSGTELTATIRGRQGYACTGLARERGVRNGCPDIEAYVAPQETSINGIAVIDASSTPFGLIDEPVTIEIEDGVARSISGGADASQLDDYLRRLGPEVFTAAEFGFGLNPNCRVVGRIVEDEGTYGTAHLALGSNEAFGGRNRAPAHVDLVYWTPTMKLDGAVIFRDGHYVGDADFARTHRPITPGEGGAAT